MTTTSITVTERAAERIAQIVCNEPDKKMFRISVEGGGCSGFQYRFELAEAAEPDDIAVITDGVTLLVDETALPFVAGASVDYVEALGGSSFQVKNPVATAGCGCGSSFAV